MSKSTGSQLPQQQRISTLNNDIPKPDELEFFNLKKHSFFADGILLFTYYQVTQSAL